MLYKIQNFRKFLSLFLNILIILLTLDRKSIIYDYINYFSQTGGKRCLNHILIKKESI